MSDAVTIGILSAAVGTLSAILAALIAGIGWYVAHRLTVARDRKNKLIDLRNEYLMSIYRKMERTMGKTITREMADEIEIALTDIQLLGDAKQVQIAKQFIKDYGSKNLGGINIGVLTESIRCDIRRDLGLDTIVEPVDHLRLHLHNEQQDSSSS
jgi:hypothetical protein